MQEVVPIVLDSNWTSNYSANYYYPLAAASTSTAATTAGSTTSAATSTISSTTAATTSAAALTTTATQPATVTVTVTTITAPVPTKSTGPTTDVATTPAAPKPRTTKPILLGKTVMLARRSQRTHCTRGVLPDHQCSPGAYYSKLTKAVLCSSSFRTGTVGNVPNSEKHQVETEYGMPAKPYGRAIEIDRVVSLGIGGSNDISNLYPEPGSGAANYHAKDRLENKLHDMVCAGEITLSAAQHGIAKNWETLYAKVFGRHP
ncbi:MAG TPA: hypothetical protein VHC67_04140 [Gaiellaceae bacterium]|nr:hypothetical protein [Gaiellaceae bacterium]